MADSSVDTAGDSAEKSVGSTGADREIETEESEQVRSQNQSQNQVKINSVETQLPDWQKANKGNNYIARNLDGIPIPNLTTSLTLGENGPVLLQDDNTLQFIQDFNRQNIPERITHPKGFGAHGIFKVTHDITDLTYAKIFSKIGKETPFFSRWSSANVKKLPDGSFSGVAAFKFYTEDGNWDLLTRTRNPFGINDPSLFVPLNRAGDFNPDIPVLDYNMLFDFFTRLPETIGNTLSAYSDAGNPRLFQHFTVNGINTFKLINATGEYVYCKWTVASNNGFQTLTLQEKFHQMKNDPDFQTRSLFNAIANGEKPSWTLNVQTMTEEQIANFGNKKTGAKWNAFDVTKRWPPKDYPMRPVGVLTLTRNVDNDFNETEQSAFCPGRLVPGMDTPIQDINLQGRTFAYTDAQIHRMGVNFQQLSINSPRGIPGGKPHTYERDGFMCGDTTNKGAPNYYPNSFGGPIVKQTKLSDISKGIVKGRLDRIENITPERDFLTQPREFWDSLPRQEKQRFAKRLVVDAAACDESIKERLMAQLSQVNPEIGKMLRKEFLAFIQASMDDSFFSAE